MFVYLFIHLRNTSKKASELLNVVIQRGIDYTQGPPPPPVLNDASFFFCETDLTHVEYKSYIVITLLIVSFQSDHPCSDEYIENLRVYLKIVFWYERKSHCMYTYIVCTVPQSCFSFPCSTCKVRFQCHFDKGKEQNY